jgi:predicted PurR-regulated permease PerM
VFSEKSIRKIGVIVIIKENRLIKWLIIINLFILAFILLSKIVLLQRFINAIEKTFLVPLLLSVMLFYIMKPLNEIFIKKGIGIGKASLLTLLIFSFILSGVITYFSKYTYKQFDQMSKQLVIFVNDNNQFDGVISWINQYISINEIQGFATSIVKNYIHRIGHSFMKVASYFMNTFSFVFLIFIIVFYMLKDGHKFKSRVLNFVPEKFKEKASEILTESDSILSHYVTGQAKVALSLSTMIFIGYKLIQMPNALLLSSITFVLAFIPFVGFFISMIIPVVIAVTMGYKMVLKLFLIFIIVQTLKGRVVVPAIMAKSMNIHPLTDIFLVIAAIAVGGPFAAFAVVPIYAILKNIVLVFKE